MTAGEAYRRLLRPLLFLLNPETAHHLAIGLLSRVSHSDLLLRVFSATSTAG